jgi:hypothetical protein
MSGLDRTTDSIQTSYQVGDVPGTDQAQPACREGCAASSDALLQASDDTVISTKLQFWGLRLELEAPHGNHVQRDLSKRLRICHDH